MGYDGARGQRNVKSMLWAPLKRDRPARNSPPNCGGSGGSEVIQKGRVLLHPETGDAYAPWLTKSHSLPRRIRILRGTRVAAFWRGLGKRAFRPILHLVCPVVHLHNKPGRVELVCRSLNWLRKTIQCRAKNLR